MALILAIETSTRNCSVALFSDNIVLIEKSLISEKYSHLETLTVFIEFIMKEKNFNFSDLTAVSVSKGPGSYTGLRIGVATAKGLCYALNIPLISLGTLKSMAYSISRNNKNFDLYCPMIDARRMEVFSAFFDKDNVEYRKVQADVIDEYSYRKEIRKRVVFFGDGANKCKKFFKNKNVNFIDNVFPCASNMLDQTMKKYLIKDFENLHYFEPFYLKDFIERRNQK